MGSIIPQNLHKNIQGYFDHYSDKFKELLFGELDNNGLTCKKMEFSVDQEDERNWAYLNFLQTKDLILLPKLNIEEDNQALEQISKYYPDYAKSKRIAQVDMTDIVKQGGALNCISWTTKF